MAMHTWFECKIRYEKVMENGMQKKVTEPYLVDALSFTEAEARIIEEMTPFISGEFTVSDIKRANYSELFPSDEESAADDVIGQAIFIQQWAVHRQTKELSLRIAYQGNRLLERVHGFNISAYDPLHICETIDLLHTAGLLRFYN